MSNPSLINNSPDSGQDSLRAPSPIRLVQPGGGWCVHLELGWARIRRGLLRRLFSGYVKSMEQVRKGSCSDCSHDIIDGRDLKYFRNVCGYWFRPEDDRFRWRDRLGFSRYGLCEMMVFSAFIVLMGTAIWAGVFIGLPSWVAAILSFGLFLVWLELITFFRDPERCIPTDPLALVSPADGTITDIGIVNEQGFANGKALRIGIFLSIFNVHINRSPRNLKVTRLRYYPGKFLDARNANASVENEQLWIDFVEPDTGHPIRVKQISGAIARRIVCWLKPDDEVKPGERFGMIKFGSRTEVFIPAECEVDIVAKVGQKVQGGATVLLRILTESLSQ